jgi:hypothetical protein
VVCASQLTNFPLQHSTKRYYFNSSEDYEFWIETVKRLTSCHPWLSLKKAVNVHVQDGMAAKACALSYSKCFCAVAEMSVAHTNSSTPTPPYIQHNPRRVRHHQPLRDHLLLSHLHVAVFWDVP